MKKYEIIVSGCDDDTKITMELNNDEYLLIKKVAEEITTASSYGCMPCMMIELINN